MCDEEEFVQPLSDEANGSEDQQGECKRPGGSLRISTSQD